MPLKPSVLGACWRQNRNWASRGKLAVRQPGPPQRLAAENACTGALKQFVEEMERGMTESKEPELWRSPPIVSGPTTLVGHRRNVVAREESAVSRPSPGDSVSMSSYWRTHSG